MGSSESKVRTLNNRINYRFEKLNIDDLDRMFFEVFPLVRDVEICRCEFILRWNEFKRLSGAIVLLHPRFESCLHGMLYKLAAGMNGNLSSLQILDTEPFIQHSISLTEADQTLLRSFRELCRYYSKNTDRVYKLDSEMQKYNNEMKGILSDPETMLTDKYNVAPIDVYSFIRKLNVNAKKIYAAYDCVTIIRNNFDDMRKSLNRYASLSKVPGQFRVYENIGAEANSKKIDKSTSIMFKYSREEKVMNYEDHFDFVRDDLKAEKDARYILEEFPRETITTSTIVYQTIPVTYETKGSRLPTLQSTESAFRKETEVSLTLAENIQPQIREREVIREVEHIPISERIGESQKNIIEEYRGEMGKNKEEIIIKTKPLLEKENIQPTSQTRTVYEKDYIEKDYKPISQAKPLLERENIQPISQTKTVYETEYQPTSQTRTVYEKEYQPTTQTRTVYEKEYIEKDYKPISQAKTLTEKEYQPISQTKTMLEKEYQPTSQSQIISETRPITSTIETNGGGKKIFGLSVSQFAGTQEYENLRSEMLKLMRKNEELETRLSQSQTSFSQIQPSATEKYELSQSHMIEQPKRTITTAKTSAITIEPSISTQKMPIYVRHHIPLRSCNLFLKRTMNSSQHHSIKCIESAIDLEMVMTGMSNGRLCIWRFADFSTIDEYNVVNLGDVPIKSMMYLNDGKTLLCGTKDGKLISCDLHTFACKTLCELSTPIVALANPLNGVSILAASGKKIYEIDIVNYMVKNSFDAHDLDLTGLVYNQQKDIMCSSGKDKSVKVWNCSTKECLGVLQGHADIIKSITFAYFKEQLILCSVAKDSYITFWNLSDKNLTKSIKMDSPANKVNFMWDKKTVCTVHPNGFFNLWDIEKGEAKSFSTGAHKYSTGTYYDDGHNIFLGTNEGSLEFWNAK